jgi:hypothetical protein
MTRYSKWLGLAALAALVLACFLPWAFYADVNEVFTGFFSQGNVYGKPGKFLLIFGSITTLFIFLKNLWVKRAALLLGGLNVAYAIKNFLLFGACYRGYCPDKRIGLYLMLIATIVLFITTLLPEGKVSKVTERQ